MVEILQPQTKKDNVEKTTSQPSVGCHRTPAAARHAHAIERARRALNRIDAMSRASRLFPLVAACLAGPAGALAADCAAVRRPIVFVHGSGLAPDSWREMTSALRTRGYAASDLVAVRLTPDDGSNVRAAERFIQPAVRDVLDSASRRAKASGCAPPRKVDIVAHSMGAVSARWYVARIDAGSVLNLVGIAPANHGTDALCGHAGDGNRELCPAFATTSEASRVQFTLNGGPAKAVDETPHGFGADSADRPRIAPNAHQGIYYWTIRIDPDEWIRPANSAVLDGAGGRPAPALPSGVRETSPGNFLWPTGVRHDDLPRQPVLIDFVARLLAS
jgi:pimeloyl-ACP methyl ester carboxylesterase